MKVNQIYQNYFVPKNLQEHMLRVAALSQIILENWTGPEIDKKSIIQACTLHDIAKPITFDLAKQAQFGMSQADIDRLENHQNRLKSHYGEDEHHCTVKICEEVRLNPTSITLVDNLEWKYIPRLLQENNTASLIPIYCDMRIGPKSILPLNTRLEELKNRTSSEEYEDNVRNGHTLEQLIQGFTSTDLNSITEAQLVERFDQLLNLEI